MIATTKSTTFPVAYPNFRANSGDPKIRIVAHQARMRSGPSETRASISESAVGAVLTAAQNLQREETLMRFRADDIVICSEQLGKQGRVERVRVAACLVRVMWTRNTVSWHCEEALEPAPLRCLIADLGGQLQEVMR